MCGRCGTYQFAPRGARSVCCALCDAVTRVQRRPGGLQDFLQGLITSLVSPPLPPLPPSSWTPSLMPYRLPASYPRVYGRKRALLVGIGYKFTKYELRTTVDDVNVMSYMLRETFGFPSDSILVLTEQESDPYRRPTKDNLRLAMRWLMHGCHTGDALSLVFHFSGVGVQKLDNDGEKALCPLDFEDHGMMLESEINETIVRPLGPGVKLHAIVNAYYSRTAVDLDLPFLCRISRTGWHWEHRSHRMETRNGTNGGLAISISVCDTDNSSMFGTDNSLCCAMVRSFAGAVEGGDVGSYGRLISSMRAQPPFRNSGKFIGGPQLCASEQFDIYKKPFLL